MARWEPDARGRLERAAMELYLERGFEQTTVAEIAERAGLTERTFFRHFADKREVLFGGASLLEELMVGAVLAAPAGVPALQALGSALQAPVPVFEEMRPWSRRRQRVIAANPELQERELVKMAKLSGALAGALHQRGITEPTASLAAQSAVAVFRVAYEQWSDGPDGTDLGACIADGLRQLALVAAGGEPVKE